MGREIRRVPPNWDHPTYTQELVDERGAWHDNVGHPVPLYDEVYEDAANRWLDDAIAWRTSPNEDRAQTDFQFYWDYNGGPPDRHSYRHRRWTTEEATHFQVYETVSEGTPVSPVLPSREAVVEWAISEGYSPKAAAAFAEQGWVPSMISIGGWLYSDIESAVLREEPEP